ncbi:MAG TPA: ATP-binding protein [Gaiellaceae bacterium]
MSSARTADPLCDWLDALIGPLAEAAESGAPLEDVATPSVPPLPPTLSALCEALGVRQDDLPLLALALSPDVAPRYGRLLAHIQDDPTAFRPTVELCRAVFGRHADPAAARLAAARLVSLSDAPVDGLARVVPDAHVSGLLRGNPRVHPMLARICRLGAPGEAKGLVEWSELIDTAREGPVRIWFAGGRPERAELIAAEIATCLGSPLLHVDLESALAVEPSLANVAPTIVREAWLRDAVLFFPSADSLFGASDPRASRNLAAALADDGGVCIFHGAQSTPPGLLDDPRRPLGVVATPLFPATPKEREAALSAALAERGLGLDAEARRTVANRFRLDPDEIRGAVARASASLRLGRFDDLHAALTEAARSARGHQLAAVATRVEPRAAWGDLLLPEDVVRQLRELVALVTTRDYVWDGAGFGATSARGRGVSALFAGASGTGKTTAAEVVAGELGFDLYRIDLASVVSKYIGETEKNLDRVFSAAEGANAVLLFDEADALFGQRSEVTDAHDRYANVEIAYLLQRIEAYDGVAILTTNLRHHVDEAFLRRLSCTITFPIPDEDGRRRLWAQAWPPAVDVDAEVDRNGLAQRFRLTGGGVHNVAVYATHLAAAGDEPVRSAHVLRALRREYQKLGVALDEDTA